MCLAQRCWRYLLLLGLQDPRGLHQWHGGIYPLLMACYKNSWLMVHSILPLRCQHQEFFDSCSRGLFRERILPIQGGWSRSGKAGGWHLVWTWLWSKLSRLRLHQPMLRLGCDSGESLIKGNHDSDVNAILEDWLICQNIQLPRYDKNKQSPL